MISRALTGLALAVTMACSSTPAIKNVDIEIEGNGLPFPRGAMVYDAMTKREGSNFYGHVLVEIAEGSGVYMITPPNGEYVNDFVQNKLCLTDEEIAKHRLGTPGDELRAFQPVFGYELADRVLQVAGRSDSNKDKVLSPDELSQVDNKCYN
jgi:hypothetical protein